MTGPTSFSRTGERKKKWVLDLCNTHPVWTGLATGLMLSEVSVAGLLGMRESSSYSLDAYRGEKGLLSLILISQDTQTCAQVLEETASTK